MTKKTKVNAAILIIGNEILSGRTQDTNTSTLATWLNSIGVKVGEVRVIPDVEKTIIDTLNLLKTTYDYIFTTGGIGPTHDDITAESVSKAFGLKYEMHKEAYKILKSYYKPGEFNDGRQKMVWMPENANLILNPTSGAPGFNVKNVFCLPGVPSILKSMLGGLTNKIVEDSIRKKEIEEFNGYNNFRREVKYGENSRIDILLENADLPNCYIEVKSVTLNRPERGKNLAEFPDAVTVRGTKHLDELSNQVAVGNRAVMFYLIQRADCNQFSIADDIDPNYARAFGLAKEAGVEMLCYGCSVLPEAIEIERKIDILI